MEQRIRTGGWGESVARLQWMLRLCGMAFALFAAGSALLQPPVGGWIGPVLLLAGYSVYNGFLPRSEPDLAEMSVNLLFCAVLTVTDVNYAPVLYPLLLFRGVLRVGAKRVWRLTMATILVYVAASLVREPSPDLASIVNQFFLIGSLGVVAAVACCLHRILQNQLGQEGRVAELLNLNHHNYRLALTDELTGLYNYRAYQEMASSTQEYALLLVDIDHFKKINDTYGHLCGDQVLSVIGDLLRLSLREEDLAFRYGGEEFAVILPNASRELGLKIAERLRTRVMTGDFSWDNKRVSVAVSIGVAVKDGDVDSQTAFRQADRALYGAKRQGRNKVLIFGGRESIEEGCCAALP